jgi:hypothetical protein
MQLLPNSDSIPWTFPRCCWRFDRAKLGDRPPGGCLTASLSPTAPASSRRKPIACERSRRSPTRPVRRSTVVFRRRSYLDRIVKMAERVEFVALKASISAGAFTPPMANSDDHGAPPWCYTVKSRRFGKSLILKDFFAAENRWRREWDSHPRFAGCHQPRSLNQRRTSHNQSQRHVAYCV